MIECQMTPFSLSENLAAGTGPSYGISAAVKSWTDEVGEYIHRRNVLIRLTCFLRRVQPE